jgi:RimJ/RimL family protein N-acetyltransferase
VGDVDGDPEVMVGEGVGLRPFLASDAASVLEAVVESGATLSRYETWAHAGFTLSDAEEYVGWWIESRETGTARYFAIESPAGRFLGACGLAGIDRSHRCAGLGFWVRRSAAGRGVASEAARLVVGFAFGHLGLERVEVMAAVDNIASRRVAEKLRAQREGVLRRRLVLRGVPTDVVLFSIVRSDLEDSGADR